ncbi:MAG: SBBP repeat-containing protein [Pseudomonadota bacterium]
MQSKYFGFTADVFITKLNAAGTALVYSTYLGGGGNDTGHAVAIDNGGNAYLTGATDSADFPTSSGAYDRTCGADGLCNGAQSDAFAVKLNAAGNGLIYSTYLGGNDVDQGLAIALDAQRNAYLTGATSSINFPVRNAVRARLAGEPDAFVTKLNAAGNALTYSTYLGGSGEDQGRAIAVIGVNAFVAGETFSSNFPTQRPLQATSRGDADAFVARLAPTGNALVYSTYLGGAGFDAAFSIATDGNGNAYVVGTSASSNFPVTRGALDTRCGSDGRCNSIFHAPFTDAFVAKLNPAGRALTYSTFLGGGTDDAARGIAVDSVGNAYVTGDTTSADFPTRAAPRATPAGSLDAFVAKLNAAGNMLIYSTYLGGAGEERGGDIALDNAGNAYTIGTTFSPNFPTTPGAYDRRCGQDGTCLGTDRFGTHSFSDAFASKIGE